MRFAFSTLGCPGAPLDHVLELAKGNDNSGLELRTAPDEFTNTGLSTSQRRELRTRIEDAGLEILAVSSYVKLCAVEDQPLEAHLELAADLGARGVLDPGPQLAPLRRAQPGVGELVRRGAQFQSGNIVALGKLQDMVEGRSGATERGEG